MALSSQLRRVTCRFVQSYANTPHIRPAALTRGLHVTSRLRNEHIINIQDEADFRDRVVNSITPVVVDFHATWCGPCKLLGPRLESLIASRDGSVVMAKVDIDEHSDIALDHGVEAVPTVLAVKNGQVIGKFVGLKDDAEINSFIGKLTGD